MDNFLSRLKIYEHYPPLNQDCAKPPMQPELPDASTQPSGIKRIRFEEFLPTKVSGKATTKPT
jgi:hypothetical protein